jgi:hypothetical protein
MSNVLALDDRNYPSAPKQPWSGTIEAIAEDGTVRVRMPDGRATDCDWLESPGNQGVSVCIGDTVLVMWVLFSERPVVAGRIGRYRAPLETMQPQDAVIFEAKEKLTLRCGESSIDLCADGRVMIRGDDVLVRAKGTQRIRAGTVSIN